MLTRDDVDWVNGVVCDILLRYGDGYGDGHEVITEFIFAVVERREREWVSETLSGS